MYVGRRGERSCTEFLVVVQGRGGGGATCYNNSEKFREKSSGNIEYGACIS